MSFRLRLLNLSHFSRNISYVQGQSPSPRTREYFYYIDHQGQLFLDDTRVKNFITCFKDKKFLAFFFRHIRANTTGHYQKEFPYVSPCGREINYIHCDDVPLVFTHLMNVDGEVIQDIGTHALLKEPPKGASTDFPTATSPSTASGNNDLFPSTVLEDSGHTKRPSSTDNVRENSETLSYGGTGNMLTVPFQPEKLCMLPGSGRVYHIGPKQSGGVGLVKSSLGIELSSFFQYEDGSDPETAAPVRFTWRGENYILDNSVLEILDQVHR